MLAIGHGGIGFGASSGASGGASGAFVPGLSPIGGFASVGDSVAPEPDYPLPNPAPGLLGDVAIEVFARISATILGAGLLGDASVAAEQRPTALVSGVGLLGTPAVVALRLFPRADDLPSGVVRYFCRLTGSPDLILPISSFSVRHRVGTASYYNIVIPSYDFVAGIAARPLGQIVIWSDTDGVEEELSRGTLGDVRTDRGPRSQSITISGNSSQASTPKLTYILDDALYVYSTFDGEQRLRIKPRAAIRPGDFVQYGSIYFEVGMVSWSVSGSDATMEIATAAIE